MMMAPWTNKEVIEELFKDKAMHMDICSSCKQVVGDVMAPIQQVFTLTMLSLSCVESLIQVTWSVLARQLRSRYADG
ncbi:predicted protein [Lichtheimia corymbifera JMRC:FSU:9682]|uniref:Uncharacterized protein n=1 Tax=Lichtheimia corymbifera JMRC:FSU:9682 TaxID=1263082 RepID=A0A068RZR2_9FUNG|nr:predicted protein [Lichtheimia corymbifera JMRC:FSU:9682]